MPYKDLDVRKAYQKAYSAQHYLDNQEAYKARALASNKKIRKRNLDLVRSIKEATPCEDCGNKYPYYVMQFDHIYEKNASVTDLASSCVSLARLQREIDACEIVCANCHAERTHSRKHDFEGMDEWI